MSFTEEKGILHLLGEHLRGDKLLQGRSHRDVISTGMDLGHLFPFWFPSLKKNLRSEPPPGTKAPYLGAAHTPNTTAASGLSDTRIRHHWSHRDQALTSTLLLFDFYMLGTFSSSNKVGTPLSARLAHHHLLEVWSSQSPPYKDNFASKPPICRGRCTCPGHGSYKASLKNQRERKGLPLTCSTNTSCSYMYNKYNRWTDSCPSSHH